MKYPQSQKIKSFPNTKRSISNLILLITSTKKIDNLQKNQFVTGYFSYVIYSIFLNL